MRLECKTVCGIYYEPVVLTFMALKNSNHNAACKASTHMQKNKSCQQWAGERSILNTILNCSLISLIEWVYKYDLILIMFNNPRKLTFLSWKGHSWFCVYIHLHTYVKTRVKTDYLNCSFLGLQKKAIFGYQHIVNVNAIIDTSHTDTWLIKRRINTNGELGRKKTVS